MGLAVYPICYSKQFVYFFSFIYFCTFFLFSSSLHGQTKPVDRPNLGVVKGSRLRLKLIAQGFRQPLGLRFSRGFAQGMYVVEQGGKIYSVYQSTRNNKKKHLFADLSSWLNSSQGEEGLLGLAFPPDYRISVSHCYVNYTTGRPSYTHVSELRVQANRVQPKSRRVLLRIAQPYRNHNGGDLAFGPDKKLYIATGDGGSAGDPNNLAQDRRSLLGKILRIDVRPSTNRTNKIHSKRRQYTIPHDNPFIRSSERKSYRGEIYAWGLRNPWRFSFDAKTGRLYAADVGQNRYEEVNLITKGSNYGWRRKEGYACYRPLTPKKKKCKDKKLVDPIHAYGHNLGKSITGGYVYRGRNLKAYRGHYFFADFVSGKVWALPIEAKSGRAVGKAVLVFDKVGYISSFGEDLYRELYLVEYAKGRIYKIVSL